MSAYMVSNETINCMVNGAIKYDMLRPFTPEQFGQILWDENMRSVNARYPDTDGAACTYVFRKEEYTDNELFGCIKCWEYQSCETNDYLLTEGFRITRTLLLAMMNHRFPEPPWGLKEK